MSAEPIEVVLLAAGVSSRMGGPDKLLIDIDGEPLLRRTARVWLARGHAITVVTRVEDNAPRTALAGLPVCFVANPDASAGQQTSVMAGLAATPLAARAVAIALADLPLLIAEDVDALLATFDAAGGKSIVIPRHRSERGNPVVLPVALARALRDEPSLGPPRHFIATHPALVHWHEAEHARFTTDLDTPRDLAILRAMTGVPAR